MNYVCKDADVSDGSYHTLGPEGDCSMSDDAYPALGSDASVGGHEGAGGASGFQNHSNSTLKQLLLT